MRGDEPVTHVDQSKGARGTVQVLEAGPADSVWLHLCSFGSWPPCTEVQARLRGEEKLDEKREARLTLHHSKYFS